MIAATPIKMFDRCLLIVEANAMRLSTSIGCCFLVLFCSACEAEKRASAPKTASKRPSNPSVGQQPPAGPKASVSRRPFLDMKRKVPPMLEWNQDVISQKSNATMSFRVESQGPFSVIVITGDAHQKLMAGNDKALAKSDMLFDANSEGPTFEGKVTVPAGSVFFIIGNRDKNEVEFHLQCFAGG
jgi:hypothetical protein